MPYYCTVPRCTSMAGKAKNVSFHQFPRDDQLAKLWNKILKRGKPYTKYSKVCSLHFKPEDYTITSMGKNKGQWRTLRKDAIPSQNLPLDSPTQYQRGQYPVTFAASDSITGEPNVMESQMRQMAQVIYVQTMLAMQAATVSINDVNNINNVNTDESQHASSTQNIESPTHSTPHTSKTLSEIEQLFKLPNIEITDNNITNQNSKNFEYVSTSFKCDECSKCFKDPDVFILHKRVHVKKESSEKENLDTNSLEKNQDTLRANPILANLLKSNVADCKTNVFDAGNIMSIENQIMAALAANMEAYIRNFTSLISNQGSNDSNDQVNDNTNNSDDCDRLEESTESNCLVIDESA